MPELTHLILLRRQRVQAILERILEDDRSGLLSTMSGDAAGLRRYD
jgi:hypothetical protein